MGILPYGYVGQQLQLCYYGSVLILSEVCSIETSKSEGIILSTSVLDAGHESQAAQLLMRR